MKTFILACLSLCLAGVLTASAQTDMRIHYTDGSTQYIPVERIDSVTFADAQTSPDRRATLTGDWLWGDTIAGYYELLTFDEDKTYTGYDNYFVYGFDTQTFGFYSQIGAMLILQSNGFGYKRKYNWYITDLTENALAVMTKMGPFTYFRLQPEVVQLRISDPPSEIGEGDSIVFADGVIAVATDNYLQGLAAGTTYILKYLKSEEKICAYKVIVSE